MSFKKYNIILISLCFLCILILITFNFIINPFNVFISNQHYFNRIRPELKRQERLTKIISLKNAKNIDTIFIGTSRTDFSLPDDYYNKITGKKSFNIAMQGLTFSEYKYIIDKALKYQPNIKNILIAVDFDFFYNLKESDTLLVSETNKNIFSNYVSILLSSDATSASFMTMIKSLNPNYKKGFMNNGMKRIFINDKIDHSFEQTINQYKGTGKNFETQPNLKPLEEYIKYLNKKNINVILYMHPVHSTMYEIIKENNAWDKVSILKKELANIQPFYDFYYSSEYSNETIEPKMKYFFETSHCTYLVGEKIIDKIFLNQGDYGIYVTPQNVDYYNNIHKKELIKWEKNNSKWITKIKNITKEGNNAI